MFHHTCRPQSEVHFSALPDLGPSCAFVGQFFHTRSRVGGQTFCQCCLPLLKNLPEFRAKFLPTQVFQQSKEDHTGKRLYLLTIGYKRRPPTAGFEIKSPQAYIMAGPTCSIWGTKFVSHSCPVLCHSSPNMSQFSTKLLFQQDSEVGYCRSC